MEQQNKPLSRSAQLTALKLFPVHYNAQVSFKKHTVFDPRGLEALGELEERGLVKAIRYRGGAVAYTSTRELRELMGTFGRVQRGEVFEIVHTVVGEAG